MLHNVPEGAQRGQKPGLKAPLLGGVHLLPLLAHGGPARLFQVAAHAPKFLPDSLHLGNRGLGVGDGVVQVAPQQVQGLFHP